MYDLKNIVPTCGSSGFHTFCRTDTAKVWVLSPQTSDVGIVEFTRKYFETLNEFASTY